MEYIEKAKLMLSNLSETMTEEIFVEQYESLESVKIKSLMVSKNLKFSVFEDGNGVLYLVTYKDNNDIIDIYYGYELHVHGLLSKHIRDVMSGEYYTGLNGYYDFCLTKKDIHDFKKDHKNRQLLVVMDETALYMGNRGVSSMKEFTPDNLLIIHGG